MIEGTKKMGVGMWVCAVLLAAAVVLIAAGVTGAWVILFIVPCMLMMGGMGHGDSKK